MGGEPGVDLDVPAEAVARGDLGGRVDEAAAQVVGEEAADCAAARGSGREPGSAPGTGAAGKAIRYHPGMSEIVFVVEEAPEGGFTARAVGESIFTEADDLVQLHERAREAVRCHFDQDKAPKLIRLHYVRDEVIAA